MPETTRRGARTRVRTDEDGVRVMESGGVRKRVWAFAGLVALVAAVSWWATAGLGGAPPKAGESKLVTQPAPSAAPVLSPRPVAAPPPVKRTGTGDEDAAGEPAERNVPPTPPRDPGYTISGERTGMKLFPPPGTKPLKSGIIVPEGFKLPEGYVRFYQTTDDGKRLPAILMFHPDYEMVDANGKPIPLPKDRIVPPELAPPGMPVRMLQLPKRDDAIYGP